MKNLPHSSSRREASPVPLLPGTIHIAEVRIEDLDRFLTVFSTAGLEKRARHGSLGAEVLATTEDNDRVFVLIDWRDRAAFEAFLADLEVPPTMARGGAKGRPSFTPVTGQGRLAA